MGSKIKIIFDNVPAVDTELIILDTAFPAVTIKETFKNARTQFGESARGGSVFSAAYNYSLAILEDYANSDYDINILSNGYSLTIESSNPLSSFSVTSNTTNDAVETEITNVVPEVAPVVTRTLIDSEEQITFVSSPIHIRLQNAATSTTIESAYVYLWIWNGAQNKTLNSPNLTLFKNKVSDSDAYINFQIADYIKAFLENPDNAPNTNQPNFAYNEATAPAITGQGVFWQIVTDITSNGLTVRNNYETNFATLGYRWNYEQNAIGNNGLFAGGSTGFTQGLERWYNERVHNYISQSFDLTKTIAAATAGNLITVTPVTPPEAWSRCSIDSSLIVYINKLGLWDMFTPHGKIKVPVNVDSSEQNKSFRDPSQIDNTYTHSKLRTNLDASQEYVVNTGSLTESMINQVEQIIYSPKIYLILFNGDVQVQSTVGITIDSTFITIDDTNITIDSATVEEELVGQFKTFQQIPVTSLDKSFIRKTRINDKNKIDYNLKFKETNNKILDIK